MNIWVIDLWEFFILHLQVLCWSEIKMKMIFKKYDKWTYESENHPIAPMYEYSKYNFEARNDFRTTLSLFTIIKLTWRCFHREKSLIISRRLLVIVLKFEGIMSKEVSKHFQKRQLKF